MCRASIRSVGKKYLPNEEDLWRDKKQIPNYVKKIDITPVINHPHTDKENGQYHTHYHADYRFIKTEKTVEGHETSIPKKNAL